MNTAIRQIFDQGLGDARLRSIAWTDEDLILDLILPGNDYGYTQHLGLCFTWVSRLRVDLDYGEYAGPGLLFSAQATQLKDNRWKVVFEFGAAPDGSIEFECNTITEAPDGAVH